MSLSKSKSDRRTCSLQCRSIYFFWHGWPYNRHIQVCDAHVYDGIFYVNEYGYEYYEHGDIICMIVTR